MQLEDINSNSDKLKPSPYFNFGPRHEDVKGGAFEPPYSQFKRGEGGEKFSNTQTEKSGGLTQFWRDTLQRMKSWCTSLTNFGTIFKVFVLDTLIPTTHDS